MFFMLDTYCLSKRKAMAFKVMYYSSLQSTVRLPKLTPKRPSSLLKESKETSALRVICFESLILIALMNSKMITATW